MANTWISILPSDGGEYTTVIAAVTLKSDFENQTLLGPCLKGVVVVDGQRCIPITGHVSSPQVGVAKATLYVTDSKTPLPVEYKAGNSESHFDDDMEQMGSRRTVDGTARRRPVLLARGLTEKPVTGAWPGGSGA